FIDQAADGMLLFSEMMRDNKRLQKLPFKYLYDITMTNFIPTVSRRIVNGEPDCYLAASIMSMHYLIRAVIPQELFNGADVLGQKWLDTSDVEKFTSLNVQIRVEDIIQLPMSYYSIRELTHSSLNALQYFSKDLKKA